MPTVRVGPDGGASSSTGGRAAGSFLGAPVISRVQPAVTTAPRTVVAERN
jgi:hypothetical protein